MGGGDAENETLVTVRALQRASTRQGRDLEASSRETSIYLDPADSNFRVWWREFLVIYLDLYLFIFLTPIPIHSFASGLCFSIKSWCWKGRRVDGWVGFYPPLLAGHPSTRSSIRGLFKRRTSPQYARALMYIRWSRFNRRSKNETQNLAEKLIEGQ